MDDGDASTEQQPFAILGFGDNNGFSNVAYYEIYPKQEFQIGRDDVEQMLQVNDPLISNKHISIRCIQFDEDTTWGVPPVIYAEDLSTNGSFVSRMCDDDTGQSFSQLATDRIRGSIPFLHGDRLYLNLETGIFVELRMQFEHQRSPISHLMKQEAERFGHEYEITPQVVGVGGHGTVYIARHRQSAKRLACKVMPLHGANGSQVNMDKSMSESSTLVQDNTDTQDTHSLPHVLPFAASLRLKIHRIEVEYDILKDLSHQNVISVHGMFVTTHHIYIMQELITGGDLLSFMEYKGTKLSDAQSVVVTLQILKAVEYLHDNDIVHRDIKPDNILMGSWKNDARVVLTDFGHAKRIGSARSTNVPRRMFSAVGTVGYTAPEVHKQNMTIPHSSGYGSAVDMWSVGTVTALLLTGNLIFAENNNGIDGWQSKQAKLRAAAKCDLSMIDRNEGEWASVNKRGKAFVKSLLVLDEGKRMTAKQALQHPFLTSRPYSHLLGKIYGRIVQDWRPRPKTSNIVRRIDTTDIAKSISADATSGYFDGDQHASPAESRSSQRDTDSALDHEGQVQQSPEMGEPWQREPTQASALQSLSRFGAEASYEYGTWPKTQFSSIPETTFPPSEL